MLLSGHHSAFFFDPAQEGVVHEFRKVEILQRTVYFRSFREIKLKVACILGL
jgi:hypothetical protein